ncbi:MAG: hypothetical protein GWP70_10465 [Proteobacteria bacterium]|nr:hypothetical protein [Pseudomonadota bacterium]
MRLQKNIPAIALLLLGALLGFFSQAAWARDLSHRFIEVTFVDVELFQTNTNRISVAGSMDFGDTVFLSGGYETGDVELGLSVPDVEFFHLGGGVYGPITRSIEWVVSVEYALVELSRDGFSEDADGYFADLGIRGLLANSFEYSLAIIQTDLGSSATGYEVGARYHFGESPLS